ncbi:MAG: SAM-dependent methyltransferase, partial [Lachnospiraceae bacterium]
MAEMGHEFLARLGKTKLRPGGIEATDWILKKADIKPDSK